MDVLMICFTSETLVVNAVADPGFDLEGGVVDFANGGRGEVEHR